MTDTPPATPRPANASLADPALAGERIPDEIVDRLLPGNHAVFHKHGKRRAKHRWRRGILWTLGTLIVLLVIGRLCMPPAIKWYVNRTIDRSPLYDGQIGGISVHLYRGAYTIHQIQLIKTTGNVPVPLFKANRVDLAIEWGALWTGSVVGQISMESPEINFVDGEDKADSQSGGTIGDADPAAGEAPAAPWLEIIRDLFPFRINSARVHNGSIHLRTFQGDVPVDVYLSQLEATLDNLTNIQNTSQPMITTAKATGLAMDHAKFEYEMKLDPFSYQPTFRLVTRLLGLDVTQLRDLCRHYGGFDFEHGWFDLVVELAATEGQLRGYVKPLFRDLKVIGQQDLKEDDPLGVFWEAIVGVAAEAFKNQPRDQLGTLIPFKGSVSGPRPDLMSTIGNVLRNAFIRAYLPKLQGDQQVDGLQFGPPSLDDPATLVD